MTSFTCQTSLISCDSGVYFSILSWHFLYMLRGIGTYTSIIKILFYHYVEAYGRSKHPCPTFHFHAPIPNNTYRRLSFAGLWNILGVAHCVLFYHHCFVVLYIHSLCAQYFCVWDNFRTKLIATFLRKVFEMILKDIWPWSG